MSNHLKRLLTSLLLTTLFLLPQAYKVVHDLTIDLSPELECSSNGDHLHALVNFHDCDLCDYQLTAYEKKCKLRSDRIFLDVPAKLPIQGEAPSCLLHFNFQLRGPPIV